MARGGSRGRRNYVRDSNGRFSSTPGGGPSRTSPGARRAARAKVTGGTLRARTSAKRSKARLAAKDPADQSLRGTLSRRAQKGAVTRTQRGLKAAQASSRVRLAPRAGVIRPGKKGKAAAPAAPQGPRLLPPAREAVKTVKRLGLVAGPLTADGARKRGETTKNRSDVSGAVADMKALGLPIYKPGQAGLQVRKGPKPGTVGIITHTTEAFDKALAQIEKQGGQIVYQNRQGLAFTFRNTRKPKPPAREQGGAAKPKRERKGAAGPATSSPDRKAQLKAGAKKRRQQADRIDAQVAALEKEYRSKDSAFYTQGVKTRERDRMHEKMQRAAALREQSKALRQKADNAERMAARIKDKPAKENGGDARLARAIANEAAGGGGWRKNPKGQRKKVTALNAQKIYRSGDPTAALTLNQRLGKGFREPRSRRN